ncbi:MAG: HAD family phosphatase [Clostridiales bacterium]|nr:HAD family phosphatase [Clostridiales bacterium]
MRLNDNEIKAVIFDMDGLMIDTEKLYQRFWKEALEFYGFHATQELLLNLRSLSRDLAKQLLKDTFGNSVDYSQVRLKRVELMDQYIFNHGVEKKDGLDHLLDFLKQNEIRMAVATATEYERTKRYLSAVNVFHYFDYIVCGTMVPHGKPAPDIYQKAVELLGLQPKECLALEDSPNGANSALSAGCHVIMVPEHGNEEEELAVMKVCSLNEVIGLLR